MSSSKRAKRWKLLDSVEESEERQPELVVRERRKGNTGRFPVRTHFEESELDKTELMLKKPIRKKDVIGGRKMVFYQYKPELYNPKGTNFAGRRKSDRTSEYRGVYWNKNHRKWEVKIKIGKKTISLGYEHTEEGAARLYDKFITKFIINRLAINFPEDIGGTKLSLKDLLVEDQETLEEGEDKKEERSKVQDLMLDFGLDDEAGEGCKVWPGSRNEDGESE